MGTLVVIGNFDGVHRGHCAVLEGALEEARERKLEPCLLTFYPHPVTVLGKISSAAAGSGPPSESRPSLRRVSPPLLTRQARKKELVARVSPEIAFREDRFDLEYASQSPAEFCAYLRDDLEARSVVVGQNFRFGKDRAGDFGELARDGVELGFTARSEPLRGDDVGPWSSTRARAAIAAGDLGGAEVVLGRPHMLSGTVVHGKKLGRTIGFPTCNLDGVEEALPPLGIYAVLVDLFEAGRATALAKGALSIGTNPTTDGGDPAIKVEVYLFDIDCDLYGAELRVHLIARLRPEAKFDGLAELVAQMKRDVELARQTLEPKMSDPRTGAFG